MRAPIGRKHFAHWGTSRSHPLILTAGPLTSSAIPKSACLENRSPNHVGYGSVERRRDRRATLSQPSMPPVGARLNYQAPRQLVSSESAPETNGMAAAVASRSVMSTLATRLCIR